ncbi:MAG TPA: beta-xylosidase [Candidatus Binatia bacterium]|nr:beta-xylosidase [Candidatus Binatia bacterium]
MVTFQVDLAGASRRLPHFWERVVGSGHAPLALRADWQQQLRRCHQELGFNYVRFHGLLSHPMYTLINHAGGFVYSFFNADQIIDFLLSIGMRPFVELSFMPAALASGAKTVFSYASNVTPPRDYEQWATLIGKLVRHWVERYGPAEVRQWFLEVWNEPNLDHFWAGNQEEYFRLYRYTVEAIKEIDPSLRVGGPATAQNEWIADFLDYCDRNDLPVDFVTTHYYPTDAFGRTTTPTEKKLADTPRDVMGRRARQAREQAGKLPLYYTEWNIASNPRHELHDLPFAAASAGSILMDVAGCVDGYSYWTFSDIFEELYFPSEPFHGGFGLLTLHGIAKPVYRAFQMLHSLGNEQLPVEGQHETVRCWVVRKEDEITALIVNHARPHHPIETETVNVELMDSAQAKPAAQPSRATLRRIDDEHANARRTWEEMGRPGYLDQYQLAELQVASQVRAEPLSWQKRNGDVTLAIDVPPHGFAAMNVSLRPKEQDG